MNREEPEPWEVRAIERMDNAYLAQGSAKPVSDRNEIPASDVKGVKGLFRSVAAAQKAKE